MDDEYLINFITNILSESGTVVQYKSMFQELYIDRNVRDLQYVQQRVYEWIKRRL